MKYAAQRMFSYAMSPVYLTIDSDLRMNNIYMY